MTKNQKLVLRIAHSLDLEATLIRKKKHLCFCLSKNEKSRLLVTAKTPSDYLAEKNVASQIRQIARALA